MLEIKQNSILLHKCKKQINYICIFQLNTKAQRNITNNAIISRVKNGKLTKYFQTTLLPSESQGSGPRYANQCIVSPINICLPSIEFFNYM